MLAYHCETVNHKRHSVNESFDDKFARKRLELKSNMVVKNIQVFLASGST